MRQGCVRRFDRLVSPFLSRSADSGCPSQIPAQGATSNAPIRFPGPPSDVKTQSSNADCGLLNTRISAGRSVELGPSKGTRRRLQFWPQRVAARKALEAHFVNVPGECFAHQVWLNPTGRQAKLKRCEISTSAALAPTLRPALALRILGRPPASLPRNTNPRQMVFTGGARVGSARK
jgi:hypothetical protein